LGGAKEQVKEISQVITRKETPFPPGNYMAGDKNGQTGDCDAYRHWDIEPLIQKKGSRAC
jgi:hypothetical protein